MEMFTTENTEVLRTHREYIYNKYLNFRVQGGFTGTIVILTAL